LFITVVEFEGHVECLISFFNIFKHEKVVKIAVFTSESLANEIEAVKHQFKNVDFYVKPNEAPIDQFLSNQLAIINTADYIIFNTLQKQPHLYQLNQFKPKTIIRVHNINTFLNRKNNIKINWNWYDLYKDFSYFIREYLWAKQILHFNRLLAATDFIMLPNDGYTNYVTNNKLYPAEKIFPSIPMAVHEPSYHKKIDENVLTLCITGTIDAKRKDYLLAFNAINEVLPNIFGSLRLILLGAPKGPYGLQIIKKFNSIAAKNFELISFDKRIDQATFEQYIKETDILLAPVLTNTRYKFFKEVYGTTKISGSITDMIRYGKPLFLVNDYQLFKELTEVVTSFANKNELKKLIIATTKNKKLLIKQQQKLNAFLKNYDAKILSKKSISDFYAYKSD